MPKSSILSLLQGGDRRSIGRSNEVAARVLENPRLFPTLISGLWHDDPLVRMRAADAAEKITRQLPELLVPHKKELLGLMAETEQADVRWHLSVIAPRFLLSIKERQLVMSLLMSYLQDRRSIVKTLALQGLADLAHTDPAIRMEVRELLQQAARSGTPAMKARSRKLLKKLLGY
ncbi:MAG TPA: hypothetical protein VHA33_23395 [Candidatus Angelobacter sp.]|jgi:hypothetical protein|nr:hypothetical protein [Candidatus Angelobacter sp.]